MTELELELHRIQVEQFKANREAQTAEVRAAEERVARIGEAEQKAKVELGKHKKMTGENRAWTISVCALVAFFSAVAGIIGINAVIEKQTDERIGIACVTAGNEWKQNLNNKFECIEKKP